jgi:hypothetical protein
MLQMMQTMPFYLKHRRILIVLSRLSERCQLELAGTLIVQQCRCVIQNRRTGTAVVLNYSRTVLLDSAISNSV